MLKKTEAPGFSVEEHADSYRINRFYNDRQHVIDVAKELLTSGDENGFIVPSLPMYHALFEILYDHRSEETEPLRAFLESQLEKHLGTASQITYVPEGRDMITHRDVTKEEVMLGRHGLLRDAEVCSALLETQDLAKVNQVYAWLADAKPYVWCGAKPVDKPTTRGVSIGKDQSRIMLIGNDQSDKELPALGLRIR